MDLPPTNNPERLKTQILAIARCDQEDALQEAWVAHLQGECPVRAVWRYAKRERDWRARKVGTVQTNRSGDEVELRTGEHRPLIDEGPTGADLYAAGLLEWD